MASAFLAAGSKTYEQKNSDISAVLLQVGDEGRGRALILAFRGTEPFKNVNVSHKPHC